jgi:hypothetical protein
MAVIVAPAPTALATGLGGVGGCSYRPTRNDLIFVELDGKLSRLSLVRPVLAVVSTGTATLHGTSAFDLDTGAEAAAGGDISWEQHNSVVRTMEPVGAAQIANIGVVVFSAVTPAVLQHLAYVSSGIGGNADATNQLVVGDVFAVRTNGGNYAKVQVIAYGYDLRIQWTTYELTPAYEVLGTGYDEPVDVAVTADERTAYVTERGGTLRQVELEAAVRNGAAATVVLEGMTAPHQIALDEDHHRAFVVECAPLGRLLRIDLGSGAATAVVSNLHKPTGLLLSSDRRFAYVAEELPSGRGKLSRVDLSSGRREPVAESAAAPYGFLRWADAGESAILATERDPANELWRVELSDAPVTAEALAVGAPAGLTSVAVIAPDDVVCCSDGEIEKIELGTDAIYRTDDATLLGIGIVPARDIVSGYATTDRGSFFRVRDAPFGGTLPLMVNHALAHAEGGRYYKVFVDGDEAHAPWADYRWDNAAWRFVATPAKLSASGFFAVRPPTDLWHTRFLGYSLDSRALTNGDHTLEVRVYTSQSPGAEIMGLRDSLVVRIDNRRPSATIDCVLHDGRAVDPCAIVVGADLLFSFAITASDAEGHLKSWSLAATWRDDGFDPVACDTYENHLAAAPVWGGIAGATVPDSPWDGDDGTFASTHCLHVFHLDVWDRVIDGRSHIHGSRAEKTIAIVKS